MIRGACNVTISGDELSDVESFKYLGCFVQWNGGFDEDVKHRVLSAGRIEWRGASGVLCDKRIPTRPKGKFYKSVVRPTVLCGVRSAGRSTRIQSR